MGAGINLHITIGISGRYVGAGINLHITIGISGRYVGAGTVLRGRAPSTQFHVEIVRGRLKSVGGRLQAVFWAVHKIRY